jgi:hypothetical protein
MEAAASSRSGSRARAIDEEGDADIFGVDVLLRLIWFHFIEVRYGLIDALLVWLLTSTCDRASDQPAHAYKVKYIL